MRIGVRALSPEDASRLARMHAECFEEACWSEGQFLESLAQESTQGWFAMMDGEPAGFLLCQNAGGQMDIITFGVRPLYRRLGVGERLLRSMLNSLPDDGAAHLEVAADNEAARRLYAKCGFAETGVRQGYYRRGDHLVDAVRYRFEWA